MSAYFKELQKGLKRSKSIWKEIIKFIFFRHYVAEYLIWSQRSELFVFIVYKIGKVVAKNCSLSVFIVVC